MAQPGGYHDDSFEGERDWRRRPGGWLVTAATALIVVSAVAAAGWLWLALRTQGVIGAEDIAPFDATPTQRLDYLVSTLDGLVIAVLGLAFGLALRRHAEDRET